MNGEAALYKKVGFSNRYTPCYTTYMHKKHISYALLGGHLLVIAVLWHAGSWTDLRSGDIAGQLLAAGRLAGLLLTTMTLLQLLLMSRAPWIEQAFGLDKLARVHHTLGKYFILPLVAHPVLITAAYATYAGLPFFKQYLSMLQYEDMLGAVVGFWLFLGIIIYSILQVWKRWNFERWYYVHLALYLAVAVSFGHQLELGGDFTNSPVATIYWFALYASVALTIGVFRFALPLWKNYKHQFQVTSVSEETSDVYSVEIGGKSLDAFHFTAGQFLFVRFLAKPFFRESHPFSISKSYDGRTVRQTIKGIGDFTKTISQIPVGTKVYVEGPYGIFTAKRAQGTKILALAGGIGITPFVGLLEDLGKAGKDIELIYGNKTESDIALRKELEVLAVKYKFKIHHVLSNAEVLPDPNTYNLQPTTYSSGFITPELITQLVPDAATREVFLCGPPVMMNGLLKSLPTIGIDKNKIYFEKFSL